MHNYNLTKSVFAALLLVSTVAGAEDQYPASDFQPKVVFQDESAGKEAASSSSSSKSAPAASSSSNDSQYPAANFEPKVVFSDSEYKHTASSPNPNAGSSYSSSSTTGSASSTGNVEATAPAKDDSSMGYLLGLIALGGAGFYLFKKGAIGSATLKAPVARNTGGLTGVGRYILKASGTGVSRYLEKNAGSSVANASVTGVAKYLATKEGSSTKSATGKAATGVEKYMRNKG